MVNEVLKHAQGTKVMLERSHKGYFLGPLCLFGCFISLIIYWTKKSTETSNLLGVIVFRKSEKEMPCILPILLSGMSPEQTAGVTSRLFLGVHFYLSEMENFVTTKARSECRSWISPWNCFRTSLRIGEDEWMWHWAPGVTAWWSGRLARVWIRARCLSLSQ